MIIRAIFCLISIVGSTANAMEDDNDPDLVIVGSRLKTDINQEPADIKVITAEQIRRSGAASLAEILRGVSSLQIGDNSTNVTISLRGFSAEQAANNSLILLNGRRLNNSDIAAPQLNNISVDDILRIEILNSSAGVLYGDQAIGGVINIITGTDAKNQTTATLSLGSFSTRKLGVTGHYNLTENWGLGFSIRDNASDNYREHNEEQLQQQSINLSYESETAGVALLIEQRQLEIDTPGALLESDVNIDRRISRAEFGGDFLNTNSDNYQLSSYWKLQDNWLLEADFQHNKDDNKSLTSFINFQSFFETTTRRQQNSFTPRLRYKFDNDFGTANITSGIDINRASYNFELLGRSNVQDLSSGYIYASMPVSENLILSGGGRYSKAQDKLVDSLSYPAGVNLENSATTYSLGVIYNFSEKLRLFARVEDNFRFAKVDEQAFTPPDIFGLKPQTGVSYDFGISSKMQEGTAWKLSLYHLKLEDEIIFDPAATPPANSFFQGANVNADRSVRDGAVFEISQLFTAIFQVDFNLSWTDARFTSGVNSSNAIPGVAKLTSRVDLNVQLNDGTNLSLGTLYHGKRKQDGDSGGFFPKLKSYTLLNLTAQHDFQGTYKNWQISARINNLLNKEYFGFAQFNGFYPAAELNGQLNIRYSI